MSVTLLTHSLTHSLRNSMTIFVVSGKPNRNIRTVLASWSRLLTALGMLVGRIYMVQSTRCKTL